MYVCIYVKYSLTFVWCHGLFKLLQLSSWLKGPKEYHMQEAVSGCLVQVDFQYCSQGINFHLSELASWTIATPVSGKWNRLYFFLLLLFFLEKLSPSCTPVRICGSGWIVWIKCEILIINVRNHLDGQLWQL